MSNTSRSGGPPARRSAPAGSPAILSLRPEPLSGFELTVPAGALTVTVRVERYRRGELDADGRAGALVCRAAEDDYLIVVDRAASGPAPSPSPPPDPSPSPEVPPARSA